MTSNYENILTCFPKDTNGLFYMLTKQDLISIDEYIKKLSMRIDEQEKEICDLNIMIEELIGEEY
jgi:hypothetical protein